MRTLTGWIPTTLLLVALLAGTTMAGDGVVTAGFANTTNSKSAPCTMDQKLGGVITSGLTGVVTAGFGVVTAGLTGTGIIVVDIAQTNCGIIVVD